MPCGLPSVSNRISQVLARLPDQETLKDAENRRGQIPLQTKRGRKSVNEAETGAKPSNGWMRLLFPSLWVMWYKLCSRVGSVVVRVKMELNGKGTRHENSRKRR